MSDADYRLAHGLNAVLGWLELGNTREARAELESLPAEFSDDKAVLDVRWLLHARDRDWEGALKVAERLLQIDPTYSAGWLHRAYAVRRLATGGLAQAVQVLRPAAEKFPLEDLLQNSGALFGCKPEVIKGALHGMEQTDFTIDEIKQLIEKYKRKRVI